ncbi:hypothetical protein RKD48_005777 [Streptomyces ambofaciens]
MGRLVGEHDLLAEAAEQPVRVGVDDDPVRGGVFPAARLPGGDRGDAPVGRGRGAEQARHALHRPGDDHDHPAGPVAVPGVRDGGHRPVGQVGEAAQHRGGLPDTEDEAVRAADHLDRALVPGLLPRLLGGAVGVDGPRPARAVPAQPHGAARGDGAPVVAVDAVAQLDVGGGGVAGAFHVPHPVGPGGQRERAQVLEARTGAGARVGGGVVGEDGRRTPVQDPLDVGPGGVGRGPAAAGHQRDEQQAQRHHRGTRHPPSTSHLPDRTGERPPKAPGEVIAGARRGRGVTPG